MDYESPFQPFEILCLENGQTRLYAEVIQVVTERQLCWARPLVMVVNPELDQPESWTKEPILYDLRQGADLLCPIPLFRAALDVEVIPVLAKLESLKAETSVTVSEWAEANRTNQTHLQHFIRHLWQTRPEAFQN